MTTGTTTETKRGPIRRLASSSKALVVLLVTAASFAALWTGRATWAEIEGLLRWLVAPWLAAVGIEDAARHVGEGLKARHAATTTTGPAKVTVETADPGIPITDEDRPTPAGRSNAVETIRSLLEGSADDARVVLTVRTNTDDDKEVAAFAHVGTGGVDATMLAILEAACEEAEEHPGEVRHYAATDPTRKKTVTFSLGYTS